VALGKKERKKKKRGEISRCLLEGGMWRKGRKRKAPIEGTNTRRRLGKKEEGDFGYCIDSSPPQEGGKRRRPDHSSATPLRGEGKKKGKAYQLLLLFSFTRKRGEGGGGDVEPTRTIH